MYTEIIAAAALTIIAAGLPTQDVLGAAIVAANVVVTTSPSQTGCPVRDGPSTTILPVNQCVDLSLNNILTSALTGLLSGSLFLKLSCDGTNVAQSYALPVVGCTGLSVDIVGTIAGQELCLPLLGGGSILYRCNYPTSQPTTLTLQPTTSTLQPTIATPQPTVQATHQPTTLQPTAQITATPTTLAPSFATTKTPTSSQQTMTASPTTGSVGTTNAPTSNQQVTKSPTGTSAGGIGPMPLTCGPQSGISKNDCYSRMSMCTTWGARLKWTGNGCRRRKRPLGDGGCQCIGYCGYRCKASCNSDPLRECIWDNKLKACKVRATGQVGRKIADCRVP